MLKNVGTSWVNTCYVPPSGLMLRYCSRCGVRGRGEEDREDMTTRTHERKAGVEPTER